MCNAGFQAESLVNQHTILAEIGELKKLLIGVIKSSTPPNNTFPNEVPWPLKTADDLKKLNEKLANDSLFKSEVSHSINYCLKSYSLL